MPPQPENAISDESEGTIGAVAAPSQRQPVAYPRRAYFSGTQGATFDGGLFGDHIIHTQYVFNTPPMLPTFQSPPGAIPPNQTNVPENHQHEPNMSLTIRRSNQQRPSRILSALARIIRWRRPQLEIPTTNTPPLELDAFQVYKRHMLPKGYGYPLWIPQSNMRLPVPYRQTGVCIGDVGIITPEGAFDCLFNICLPRDYSINSHVPDNFEPLSETVPDRGDPISLYHCPILEYRSFSSGAYLASDDIHANQAHLNGMHFVTSAPEGAILTMPRGAHLQRLANPHQFDDYIAANAESWYKFANTTLRRGAENGDLRIVTGCHKSTVWGMATVFHSPRYTMQSHSTLRFNAIQPTHPYSGNLLYFWEVSGSVLAKVGPEAGDNDDLLDSHHSHELRNQCLFVNTHSVSIRPEVWARLTPESSVSDGEETSSSDSTHGTAPERDQGHEVTTLLPGQYRVRARGHDAVTIQSDTPPTDTVPDHTKTINNILLQQDSNLRVAITDDNEWLNVLGKEVPIKVKPSDLYSRICHINNVRKRPDGLVHFELKHRNPDKPTPLCNGDEADNILAALQQDRRTIKQILLTHFSDLRQLSKILLSGYFPTYSKSAPVPEKLAPFLMEHSDALFTFDELLETLQTEDHDSVHSLSEHFSKSELYQVLRSSALSDSSRRRYFKALADATWNGYLQFGRLQDLDEAIWLYEQAISLTPTFSPHSLVPLFGLCSALYRRFYLYRNLRDLVHLARYMRRQEMLDVEDIVDQLTNQTGPQTTHSPHAIGQVLSLKSQSIRFERQAEWNSSFKVDENMVSGYGARIYSTNLFTRITRRLNRFASTIQEDPLIDPVEVNAFPINPQFRELQELANRWIQQKETPLSMLWFYGPSATAMVKGLIGQPGIKSHVISTFDFSDMAAWTTEVYELFPSIAVELAFKIPGLLEHYMSIPSDKDQQMIYSSLGIQFWGLIIDPLRRRLPCQNVNHIPTTIIINGLDKCGYKIARVVINLITEAVVMFALPLRFIVTSNKNPRIQDIFDGPLLSRVSRQFFVGTQASDPKAVNSPSDLLRGASVRLPPDVFDILVERSRGLSVYAETLVRFIKASEEDPTARLNYILEPAPTLRPGQELTAAFADLDSLFTKILSTHHDPNALVHALGILLVLHDCAQPQTIAQNIFGLLPRSEFFSSVSKVLQSLMHLPKVDNLNERHAHPWLAIMTKVPSKDQRALKNPYLALPFLSLSTAITTAYTIPLAFRDRVHDSFYDFLVNPERSGRFHIDISYFHGQVAMRGFAFITHQLWRDWRPPKHLDVRNAPTFSLETWDYLKFHLPAHYAQCSEKVREQIIEQMQDALEAALNNEKEKAHSEGVSSAEDFVSKVAVLIELMVNDWDSSAEWSHYASSKDKSRRTSNSSYASSKDKSGRTSNSSKEFSREHLFNPYPTDKHEDFHRLMDAFNNDDTMSRRSHRRLRRLSGRFRPDFHSKIDRLGEKIHPWFCDSDCESDSDEA